MAEQRVHYIHRLSYSARERLVGVFVLVALAVVFGLIFVNSRTSHLFEERIGYHAYLKNAQGVSTESVVKISGIEVGRVSSIDIAADNRVHLELFVYKRFQNLLRADSRGALSKLSVLGKAVIDISAGSVSAPLLPEGATLHIEEPKSLDELMADLTPVLEKVNRIVDGVATLVQAVEPGDVAATSREMARTLESLRAISEQIASGKGAVGHAVFNADTERQVSSSLASLESLLRKADQRLSEMEPLLANAGAITAEGRTTTKALSGLVVEAKDLVNQMNTAMGTVNVELQQLPELVSRMKLLMDSTDRTLQGMQRIWPLSAAVPADGEETLIEAQPRND
ncbi:MlaD family protein [Sulfurivermis fontis]|uniref:MlaD family protein n=1 Tax=Sulfurivermis fontis TaxID=1972068 RepID=UPI000FDB90B8|nr:MlaD family protein [Sulfurivermis fontis]